MPPAEVLKPRPVFKAVLDLGEALPGNCNVVRLARNMKVSGQFEQNGHIGEGGEMTVVIFFYTFIL